MGGGRFELNRFDTWSGSGERDSLSLCEAPDSRHNDAVQRVVYRGRALAYRIPVGAEEHTMAMQIARRDVGAVTVLDLKGKMAGEAGPTLSDTVETLTRDGRLQLLLNLAEVSFVDSGSLGTILSLRGAVAKQGGALKLSNVTTRISDLLVTTKLEMVFDSFGSEAEALQSFES